MKPVTLPPNQPRQFYRGGRAIAEFRTGNAGRAEEFGPEDWVASAATLFGQDAGLSTLPDGTALRDAIAADPVSYLGSAHAAVYDTSPALLVKLLDAGERLPVHVHPNREFAQKHLNCRFGKTEAWLIIGTSDSDAAVYVGFKADVDQAAVDAWVKSQRSDMLLETLNRIPVRRGDTVLIPAGTPHAIGAGVFIIELQEPTDFSVMLEWENFGLASRAEEQLGLPSALALSCLDRSGWSNGRLASCVNRGALSGVKGARSVLPHQADPFFRAGQVVTDDGVTLEPQYGVLVVLDGAGELTGEFGDPVAIHRGDTVLVPHAAGEVAIRGDVNVVRCLPPAVG
ncbi:MAG TPA: mannose-6-phosphate isomerase [Acidothermaceae bacterium]|nr:mannose-6-phosphate isomerase [Acidothermaceae bacterium]